MQSAAGNAGGNRAPRPRGLNPFAVPARPLNPFDIPQSRGSMQTQRPPMPRPRHPSNRFQNQQQYLNQMSPNPFTVAYNNQTNASPFTSFGRPPTQQEIPSSVSRHPVNPTARREPFDEFGHNIPLDSRKALDQPFSRRPESTFDSEKLEPVTFDYDHGSQLDKKVGDEPLFSRERVHYEAESSEIPLQDAGDEEDESGCVTFDYGHSSVAPVPGKFL